MYPVHPVSFSTNFFSCFLKTYAVCQCVGYDVAFVCLRCLTTMYIKNLPVCLFVCLFGELSEAVPVSANIIVFNL